MAIICIIMGKIENVRGGCSLWFFQRALAFWFEKLS